MLSVSAFIVPTENNAFRWSFPPDLKPARQLSTCNQWAGIPYRRHFRIVVTSTLRVRIDHAGLQLYCDTPSQFSMQSLYDHVYALHWLVTWFHRCALHDLVSVIMTYFFSWLPQYIKHSVPYLMFYTLVSHTCKESERNRSRWKVKNTLEQNHWDLVLLSTAGVTLNALNITQWYTIELFYLLLDCVLAYIIICIIPVVHAINTDTLLWDVCNDIHRDNACIQW